MPALGSARSVFARLALLAGAYLLLILAALLPARGLLIVAACGVAAVELGLRRVGAGDAELLDVAGAGPELRLAVRSVALTAFAARAHLPSTVRSVALVLVVLVALHVLRRSLQRVVRYLCEPPLTARGLRLRCPPLPPPPPRWATGTELAAITDLPVALGLAIAVPAAGGAATAAPVVVVALALSVVLAAAPTALLAAAAFRLYRRRARAEMADAVRQGLLDLAPEVVLYFAGTGASRYQVEMWLEPVERLQRPAVVIVRNRAVLAALAPTSLPVVCIPHAATLMTIEAPSIAVALYVSNAAGNIHLLRRRGAWSVFIGHGDSDKGASASPYSRVYDEIWVAGPAGAERYARAGVGIAPERIVEVGRPQVAVVPPRRRLADAPVTVLYAPTWEGWGDEPYATSLPHLGPRLIRALLAQPEVVVHYRPHPLTGSRNPAVRRAHAEIVALLRAAGALGSEAVRPPTPLPPPDSPPDSRVEQRIREQEWVQSYWQAGPARHRLLLAPAPPLPACFAVADGLLTDVSSVITDFSGTDRPFGVCNPADVPAAEFPDRHPSAAGGFVLGSNLAGLDAFLAAAAGGADPTRAARRAARNRLLGSDSPAGDTRFAAAVARLLAEPAPTRVPALYSESR